MTWSSTGAKHQPALDETSFQQLLSAAYVVQQHNDTAQKEQPPGRSQVLAVIAEIQSLIRTQSLNVSDSCALIGDRTLTLTGASGVSISLVDNGYLDCVAEAGVAAKIPGSSISSHSREATDQLKSGHMFESKDAQADSRLDTEICCEVSVGSLVAAPVLRFGEIAGLVEVRWDKPHGYGEAELRTCRLMAGLVTGTLERSVRIGNARTATGSLTSVESEGAAGVFPEDFAPPKIAAPLIPNDSSISPEPLMTVVDPSAAVAQRPDASPPSQQANEVGEVTPEVSTGQVAKPLSAPACRMCGRAFAGDEQFCGFCSMPRPVERPTEELQSKWASLWFMQRAQGVLRETPPAPVPQVKAAEDELRAESIPDLFPEPVVAPLEQVEPKPLMWPRRAPPERASVQAVAAPPVAPEITFPFDERPQLSERTATFAKRRWRELVLSIVALALAYGLILARPKPGQPTWYQTLMTRLGVQSQPAKVFAGTPDTRVWIDVHTQLYYCSGEDLYGKTPDGEFTTQYNAQSDGFLPASNTTCP